MSLSQNLCTFLFFVLNLVILYEDFFRRKIQNVLLITLLLLLPFWWIVFGSENILTLAPNILLSSILLIGWISLYNETSFLGAWDIKYGAILLLFLPSNILPAFVQNIGILTLTILVGWITFLLGQIFALNQMRQMLKAIIQWVTLSSSQSNLFYFTFDWVYIGFLLYLIIQNILSVMFHDIAYDKSFYLIFTIWVFLLRPAIRYLTTRWEHRIIPLVCSGILYLYYTMEFTFGYIWSTFELYIMNMWVFALSIALISGFTHKFFAFHDQILSHISTWNKMHTAPYSFVIFIAFTTTYYYHQSILSWSINFFLN